MRKFVAPLLIALAVVSPGAAFAASAMAPAPAPAAASTAAQTVDSTIKTINLTARSLTLADGSTYYLPLSLKVPNVKAGDKVTVHWQMNGSAHDVTEIDIG